MAEKNIEERDVTREEAADRLRALADDLETGEVFDVTVDNKTIALHPPESIGYELGVRESSSVLRGTRESVTIKLDWRPD